MITRIPLSYQSPAVAADRADDHRPGPRCRRSGTFTALLVASLAIGVSPGTALADPPPPPTEDHVWGGCELTGGAVAGLEDSLDGFEGEGVPSPRVDFVLVYTLQNDNDGQELGVEGGPPFTGPVLCIHPGNVDIETTEENTPIPGGEDTVDITALEQALILQYKKTGEALREKRICHTVAGNTDCFLIKPLPPVVIQ